MSLTCPICRHPLAQTGKSYHCLNRHTFDVAKAGYVSLLHGRQKGAERGDTKSMILARDRVHRAGVFGPLIAALDKLHFSETPRSIVELGCGEGYFLNHLTKSRQIAQSYGLDLSEDAVKLAAKICRQSVILRADLLHPLPFSDGSIDLVQSIFAPRPLSEIDRVLRPGGHALFVYPETDHWHELRAFVPLAKIGDEKSPVAAMTGFTLVANQPVRATIQLTRDIMTDLVEMSPSIHRLTRDDINWTTSLPARLAATLSVRVVVVRKL